MIYKDTLGKGHKVLVLVLIITLIVFYPVLSAKLTGLDVRGLIMELNDPDNKYTLKGLFLPNSVDRYYRPFLMLTFIADSKIWLLEPSGYHLTNYLLHASNAVLLFLIALRLLNQNSKAKYIAFVSTLLFSIHPLTCESVAWISGRADMLGAFFSLLAFYIYLSHVKGKSLLVILAVLLGLLSKENALASIPIILIADFSLHYDKEQGLKYPLRSTLVWLIILLIPLTTYLYLRMHGLSDLDHGIKTALSADVSSESVVHSASLLFYVPAIIAFYMKKLFFPFPLNFAIYRINIPFYCSLFVLIVIMSGYLLTKKKYHCLAWLLLMIIAFFPAVPVATSEMAWTPFGERYLYLAVPVWALGMGMVILHIEESMPNWVKYLRPAIISILLIFSITTFLRTLVWQDNLTLWADAYKKSPDFGKVLYKYGETLGGSRGLQYFRRAVEVAKDDDWKDFSLLALAEQAKKEKDYARAMDCLEKAIQIKPTPEYYYTAASMLENMPDATQEDRNRNIEKSIYYYERAYEKNQDPFALLQIGSLHTRLANYQEAEFYFNEIITKSPSSRYAKHARSRLERMKKELQQTQG